MGMSVGTSTAWRIPHHCRTFWMTVIAPSLKTKKGHILSLRPSARAFPCVPPKCWFHCLMVAIIPLMTASLLCLSFEQHQWIQTVHITHPGWRHIKFIIESMMICCFTTHPMFCLLQFANNRHSATISHFVRNWAAPTTDIHQPFHTVSECGQLPS